MSIKNTKHWSDYTKSGELPYDIPVKPQRVYENLGWVSWKKIFWSANIIERGNWLPFDQARNLVHQLKLGSVKEWQNVSKDFLRQNNVPLNAARVYKNDGWINFYDWLGKTKEILSITEIQIF